MRLQSRQAQDLGWLKALVGVMGVLIVLGTAVVVGVVVHRIYAPLAAASMPAVARFNGGAGAFVLPAGARIAGVAGAGGLVAVWVTGAAGDELLMVDPKSGAVRVAVTSGKTDAAGLK